MASAMDPEQLVHRDTRTRSGGVAPAHADSATPPAPTPPQEQLERRADPNDKEQQALLEEMRAHLKKLQEMRRDEDPRLSFSTPEFKEAQRVFTDNFKVRGVGAPLPAAGYMRQRAAASPALQRSSHNAPFSTHAQAGAGRPPAAALPCP
jgi:hypothetical protein